MLGVLVVGRFDGTSGVLEMVNVHFISVFKVFLRLSQCINYVMLNRLVNPSTIACAVW